MFNMVSNSGIKNKFNFAKIQLFLQSLATFYLLGQFYSLSRNGVEEWNCAIDACRSMHIIAFRIRILTLWQKFGGIVMWLNCNTRKLLRACRVGGHFFENWYRRPRGFLLHPSRSCLGGAQEVGSTKAWVIGLPTWYPQGASTVPVACLFLDREICWLFWPSWRKRKLRFEAVKRKSIRIALETHVVVLRMNACHFEIPKIEIEFVGVEGYMKYSVQPVVFGLFFWRNRWRILMIIYCIAVMLSCPFLAGSKKENDLWWLRQNNCVPLQNEIRLEQVTVCSMCTQNQQSWIIEDIFRIWKR